MVSNVGLDRGGNDRKTGEGVREAVQREEEKRTLIKNLVTLNMNNECIVAVLT